MREMSNPLPKGKAGMESLLFFVRSVPLPSNVNLREKLSGLPVQDSSIFQVVWLENGTEVKNEPDRIAVRTARCLQTQHG